MFGDRDMRSLCRDCWRDSIEYVLRREGEDGSNELKARKPRLEN